LEFHAIGDTETFGVSVPSIWIALAALLASSYMAACNIALKTFSRVALAERLEEVGKSGRLSTFIARLPRYLLITGILRSCTSLIVLLAILYYCQMQTRLDWPFDYLAAFLLTGALLSVFTVAIPISWARYGREPLLVRSIPVLDAIVILFTPVLAVLSIFDPIVRRLSGVDNQVNDSEEQLTEQLLSVVEEHQTEGMVVPEEQKEMIEAVVEFPSTTVGEVMTPRTDVQGIEVNSSLEEVKRQILNQGHSRLPVYEENLDNIVGILYAKDLLRYLGSDEPFELRKILRQAMMVPESKPVGELLSEFKARKVHIAIVLDEYGGTAGLVTVEDIIEEIVGEIQDEYEPFEEPPAIRRIDDRRAEVDARVYIDDLNDELDVNLPEDEDYDTVGGFVTATLGRIPTVGERFEFDGLAFTVTDAQRTHVKSVTIERLTEESTTKQNGTNAEK